MADHQCHEGDEAMLDVPEEMIHFPLGFVVDGGASVTKVLYRSNKDYSREKPLKPLPNPGRGILRLRNFNMDRIGEVASFLKENCDVNIDPEDNTTWWMTGMTAQFFKKNIEETFKIKTKLFSEMMAIAKYFKYFDQMDIKFSEIHLDAVSWAKEYVSAILSTNEICEEPVLSIENIDTKEQDDTSTSSNLVLTNCLPTQDFPGIKLLRSEVKEWVKEHLNFDGKIDTPALLVQLGSIAAVLLITTSYEIRTVDYFGGFGKLAAALGEELTGESDFDKLMKMAECGVLDNVNLKCFDIKNHDHVEDDWYKSLWMLKSEFELGKLSSNNIHGKGSYSKEDLAAGLVGALMKMIVKPIFLSAKLHNAKSILFIGSLTKHNIVQFNLAKHLLVDTILDSINKPHIIKMHFLKHPGFICSLGVWWENLKLTKEMKLIKDSP